MRKSLFEKYGGFAKISRVVSSFYDAALRSSVLAPYFRGIDMRTLIDHQTRFVSYLMGGPASYTNEHLARVHSHLHITDAAFDEMTELFRETLEDHDFDEGDISVIYAELAARRPFIVARTPQETV